MDQQLRRGRPTHNTSTPDGSSSASARSAPASTRSRPTAARVLQPRRLAGPNFDYNRDPYGVIYAIYARGLANGCERLLTRRPGGSIAPRVSPDDKTLAFIRRVHLKTVLFLRNLDTGAEQPIFDGLERDLQGKLWRVSTTAPGCRRLVVEDESRLHADAHRRVRGPSGEYFWYEHDNVWEHKRLLRLTPRDVVDARLRRRVKAAGNDDFNHIRIARHVKRLADAGVTINMGAHGQLQGLGAHWKIWMMTQGGMPPLDALRTATLNAARSLGLDLELGSLEPGKLADLVVLDRNPLENIGNTDSVAMVMVNGLLYDASTLNEVASGTKKRGALYWER